jgi:mycofactocin precursor peptide peptidase
MDGVVTERPIAAVAGVEAGPGRPAVAGTPANAPSPAPATVLAGLTWTEVEDRAAASVLAVPLGSTEQHGPHLPLSTDTDIATALALRLAAARPEVVVAPAVAYGASGEHAGFAGTLSIGQEALELLLLELGRSADAFAGTVFVSAHGGNAGPLARAVDRLRAEGRTVVAWSPGSPVDPADPASPADPAGPADSADPARGDDPLARRPDAHAGWTETSVLLALAPGSVRTAQAQAGATAPLRELMPALVRRGVAGVSANGVLGDPAGASAEAGHRLLDAWSEDLLATLEGWP